MMESSSRTWADLSDEELKEIAALKKSRWAADQKKAELAQAEIDKRQSGNQTVDANELDPFQQCGECSHQSRSHADVGDKRCLIWRCDCPAFQVGQRQREGAP